MEFCRPTAGRVYFVGAGPGDPGLLTLKGAHCLRHADVVLHDELLDRTLLDLCPPGCQRLAVGKRAGRVSIRQNQINDLLVEHAGQSRVVVRLKGGDPFVFGRGGEEALALVDAGISFEVVPGITAAVGAAAYAGIPLTHRSLAGTAVLATGHHDPESGTPQLDWSLIGPQESTLALYMASRRVAEICQELVRHGRPAQTPAALVESGTWPQQRRVIGTLTTLPALAQEHGVQPPALIIVGPVVSLSARLDWFKPGPLAGRQVLLTRAPDPTDRLQSLFAAAGARVFSLPLLELVPPADWSAVDTQLSRLSAFDWIMFSSPRAVSFFFERLYHNGADTRSLGGVRLAVLGPATAATLEKYGLRADLQPSSHSQQGMLQALEDITLQDHEILLPGADIGRTTLADGLRQRGAKPLSLTVYHNLQPQNTTWPEALSCPDLAVFASPSAVERFCQLFGTEKLAGCRIACIGPTTAAAARDQGLSVHIQPEHSQAEDLVAAASVDFAASAP
jgi:uroporphyrinogen III methyltransferase / synthase